MVVMRGRLIPFGKMASSEAGIKKALKVYNTTGSVGGPRKRVRNRDAVKQHEIPIGAMKCRRCDGLVLFDNVADDGFLWCANGHSYDPALLEEAARESELSGCHTKSGLTPRQVGQIGERLVNGLGGLGEYGEIISLPSANNRPLDLITQLQDGAFGAGEIKTVDSASAKVFYLKKTKYRLSKDAAMRESGCSFAIMVLVVLDFPTMTATVYIRTGNRFVNWDLAQKDQPFAVLALELTPEELAVVGSAADAMELTAVGIGADDIPF